MARVPKTTPEKPLPNQICGVPIEGDETGGIAACNLPSGHEGAHGFVSPIRAPEAETVAEAGQRIFAEDAVARPVIVKLARIMASLPELKPEGKNAHFGYGFIKDTQVSGALRPRLAKEHLMVIPSVLEESWVETKTAKGGVSWVTKLKIQFTVIDGESGDYVVGDGYGYGDDAGDKGANKAFTAAMKYWLMKLFEIGGEDNESDARTDQRAADRQTGAERSVTIEGGNIEGIARGGMSDKITGTQARQVAAIYKDLELIPETFALRIDQYLGDKLALPDDESEHEQAIKDWLKGLSAEDAGKLITAMVEEKDAKTAAPEDAMDPGDTPYG